MIDAVQVVFTLACGLLAVAAFAILLYTARRAFPKGRGAELECRIKELESMQEMLLTKLTEQDAVMRGLKEEVEALRRENQRLREDSRDLRALTAYLQK